MKIKYSTEKTIQYFVLGGCFLVTVFIFLNSYETVFSKDVKYISTVETINIDSIVTSVIQQNNNVSAEDELRMIEKFGVPAYLRIPKVVSKIQLMKSIKNSDDKLLCRSNSGHYLFFEGSTNKDSENIIIYIKKSWRTIDDINVLEEGDNVFVETVDNKLHMYKVDNVRKAPVNSQYTINKTDDPTLTIIIESDNDINYVIKANFVSSQNLEDE